MRGRGLVRPFRGVSADDPFSIGLTVVIGVALVGWVAYKIRNGPRV